MTDKYEYYICIDTDFLLKYCIKTLDLFDTELSKYKRLKLYKIDKNLAEFIKKEAINKPEWVYHQTFWSFFILFE